MKAENKKTNKADASASSLPQAFAEFQQLNRRVLYRQPHQSKPTPPQTQTAPDLILILSWANASLRHVAKYVVAYGHLYPSAGLMVVRTDFPEMMYRTRAAQLVELQPVIDAVLATKDHGHGRRRILLHTFSNGGAHTACYLAQAHALRRRATSAATSPLPISLLVVDSAPGGLSWAYNIRGIVVTVARSRAVQFLLYPLVLVLLCVLALACRLTGSKIVIRELRDGLNDVFKFATEARRVYVYSEGDDLVPACAVEAHAEEARRLGHTVELENFGKASKHVGHVREDAERYWGVVERAWKAASERRQS